MGKKKTNPLDKGPSEAEMTKMLRGSNPKGEPSLEEMERKFRGQKL